MVRGSASTEAERFSEHKGDRETGIPKEVQVIVIIYAEGIQGTISVSIYDLIEVSVCTPVKEGHGKSLYLHSGRSFVGDWDGCLQRDVSTGICAHHKVLVHAGSRPPCDSEWAVLHKVREKHWISRWQVDCVEAIAGLGQRPPPVGGRCRGNVGNDDEPNSDDHRPARFADRRAAPAA